jgi:hypothetical protein
MLAVEGIVQRADKLHEEHFAEYQQLMEEQKQEMCNSFSKEREQNVVLRCDTPRGRIQDFSNTVRNLKMIVRTNFLFSHRLPFRQANFTIDE